MTKITNVLIVEDEPLIINVLESVFSQISEANGLLDFRVRSATSCDLARHEIEKAKGGEPFDLVLLDINIPGSGDKKILSGEDVGLELRNNFPEVKLMVFTSHNNNYRLNNILKTLNPEGFLIKSEIDFLKLTDAIKAVLNDEPFYSKTILRLMRRHISNDFVLDKIDRQLIYQISKGAKMKELTKILPLSKSAIEYRKRNLKQLFQVEEGNDRKLLIKAEERGYI
ncbi:MAG: response regulator transcription factor [Algicola sp.]|nr:response regulator transcription factor [Algicola sp.]